MKYKSTNEEVMCKKYFKSLFTAKRLNRSLIWSNKTKTYQNTILNIIADVYDNFLSDSGVDAKNYFTSVEIEIGYKNLKFKHE